MRLEKHANMSMQIEFLATGGYVEWVGETQFLISGDRDRNESPSEEAEKRLEKHATNAMQSEILATRGNVERSISFYQ